MEDRSNDEMLIESVMCEWSQIIEITSDFDKESRKLILTTWEQEKEQLRQIELFSEHQVYDIE